MSQYNDAEQFSALVARSQPLRGRLTKEAILEQTIAIQQIPAPTFDEGKRADYIESKFRTLAFSHVERDTMHNVLGWIGDAAHPNVLLISAHHDTVFPACTDLSIKTDQSRVYGPGIGDNSLGVAALILLADLLSTQQVPTHFAICFAANTREEGLGNLDGIRLVSESIGIERIRGAIVIEGMALGRIYHGGIAVKRVKISTTAEGGHSWMSFGKPSAIHGLVQLANDITQLVVPEVPRTTYNIGMIEGGRSVNSIATDAHFILDMRSQSLQELAALDQRIQHFVSKHQRTGLDYHVEVVGERPAGSISEQHPLVRLALQALKEIGIAGILEYGSTDANILLAQQVPCVVVGISYGGNAHRLDEFIDRSHLDIGMWQLLLLTLALFERFEKERWFA